MIEDQLKVIMGRMTLSGKDRDEVEKELRSSFYAKAEAKAAERGSAEVTVDDVKKAIDEERPADDIAASYTASYTANLPRAGFWPRLVAYIIDQVLVAVAIAVMAIPALVLLVILGSAFDHHIWVAAPLFMLCVAIGVAALCIALGYVVVFEGRFGKTVGKYLMGLTVLRTNGERIGYREALLRNIPKFIKNFIILDALIMLIFFSKEKQRGFDRVADTMVVHLR